MMCHHGYGKSFLNAIFRKGDHKTKSVLRVQVGGN